MQQSVVHSKIAARKAHALVLGQDYTLDEFEDLDRIGIYGLDKVVEAGYGMDTIQQGVTTGSIGVPVQFLQNFLPGLVKIVTAVQKIDDLIGITTAGSWDDQEIVVRTLENTGTAVPYSDTTNIPLTTWNLNFVKRTVIRFEAGMMVGQLEEARAARVQVNSAAEKRDGASLNLNIQRNAVGFYGYNSGNGLTYGFLNDPNLLSYNTVATGATTSSKLWSIKNFQEIIADIRTAVAGLLTQSDGVIDPSTTDITLAVPTSLYPYVTSVTTDFGISVQDWITKTYPRMRIVAAPQLQLANGGANVFYMYADKVDDVSSDGGTTWAQVVPAKFQVTGVQQKVKGYEEGYRNATAGVICKRPYAVYRVTGI